MSGSFSSISEWQCIITASIICSTGDYETAVEFIHLDVLHREKSPFYVQIDGETLPHFLHRKKYKAASCGWYYSQTLKSVQIKYANPGKDHAVLISFAVFGLIGM